MKTLLYFCLSLLLGCNGLISPEGESGKTESNKNLSCLVKEAHFLFQFQFEAQLTELGKLHFHDILTSGKYCEEDISCYLSSIDKIIVAFIETLSLDASTSPQIGSSKTCDQDVSCLKGVIIRNLKELSVIEGWEFFWSVCENDSCSVHKIHKLVNRRLHKMHTAIEIDKAQSKMNSCQLL